MKKQATIAKIVASLYEQIRPPDRIIVISDNCTDATGRIAAAAGVDVYVTVDNKDMKAGGLNQALDLVMPGLDDDDLIICMDADTIVNTNFISEAIIRFETSPVLLGGVSGTYLGKRHRSFPGWCQRNEFARWGFDNRREHGNTVILSGAASVFRTAALRKVKAAREAGKIGGQGVYNAETITEDFELSLALRATGSTIVNMLNVLITTSVKPTWRELWVQRLRWDRGINESLFDYGVKSYTWVVWMRRVLYAIFVPVSFLCLGVITWRIATGNFLSISPFWIGVSGIIMTQKAVTVFRSRGLWNSIAAFLVIPELPYDTFLQTVFIRSLWDQATNHTKSWR